MYLHLLATGHEPALPDDAVDGLAVGPELQ